MKVVALLFLISAAYGCEYGPWGEWEDCQRTPACRPKDESLETFQSPATRAYDSGRAAMERITKIKQADFERDAPCLTNGNCKDFYILPRQEATPCVDGFAGIFPCENVDLLSHLTLSELDPDPIPYGLRGNDMWGWTDTEDNNNEYALFGYAGGTSFVRVTDPEKPERLGVLHPPSGVSASNWRDLKTVGNYVYIVSEAAYHGMQVFDLRRLRGLTEDANRQFTADYHYDEFSNAHNIVADEKKKLVYAVGDTNKMGGATTSCYGGLNVIDVSNPDQPQFVSCFSDDGYVHDAECRVYNGPHTAYKGREICYCYNENTLTIVDVTDKNDMVMLARESYPGVAYSHQGAVTEDETLLLLDDELDEQRHSPNTRTFVWDITNLENPDLIYIHHSPLTVSDHNQYVNGNYTYQSNYQGGLRILRIEKDASENLVDVGHFDVYPEGNWVSFAGTWSNYPYFRSGAVGVSSIEYGLFMVKPNMAKIHELEKSKTVRGRQQRYRKVLSAPKGATCKTVESRTCVPTEC